MENWKSIQSARLTKLEWPQEEQTEYIQIVFFFLLNINNNKKRAFVIA